MVLGSAGNDNLQITGNDGVVNVIGAAPLTPGEGCTVVDAMHVRCDVGAFTGRKPKRENAFHFVTAWGDAGNDTIDIRGDFPREFETHARGGNGNDHLSAATSRTSSSPAPMARLARRRDGDDALLSESHHTMAWKR